MELGLLDGRRTGFGRSSRRGGRDGREYKKVDQEKKANEKRP